MHHFVRILAFCGFQSCLLLEATSIVTQTITFSVNAIAEIGVSGNPPPFDAVCATAGSSPCDIEDMSTFYAVTVNGSSFRLMASINTPMPTGTLLYLDAAPPNGATSTGEVVLDVSDQDLVTGISQVAQSNLALCYTFQSTPAAGVIPSTTRIVTLTFAP